MTRSSNTSPESPGGHQGGHDPRKLDVEAFARDGASLSGAWPAADFERLAESAAADAPADGWPAVSWSIAGELRPVRGGEPEVWLHLQAQTQVSLECQRCLQPVTELLALDRSFRFVRDEQLAAELDAQGDEDVLAFAGRMDMRELMEDELLLAMPLVPRHSVCPQPLPMAAGQEAVPEERPNPFAVLAALKKKGESDA